MESFLSMSLPFRGFRRKEVPGMLLWCLENAVQLAP